MVAAGIALIAFTGLRDRGVALIAEVPQGIPLPGVPSLHDVADLLPGALAISVMAFLETVAVARGVRRSTEPQIDSDRELLAGGFASVAGSFFHSLPPAGGFSQTAVALRAGARTQLSGIVTAVLAVLVALFLAPVLSDLPQATLGAMVVVATLGLVDLGSFVRYWRVNRIEFWIAAATAAIGLTAGLLPAVLAGVLLTLYLVLRELDRPHISQLIREVEGGWRAVDPDEHPVHSDPLVLRVDSGLYTANVRANTREIARRVEQARPSALVIDCSRLTQVTTTVMRNFLDLTKELSDSGVEVYFAALPRRNIATVRRTELGRDYESRGRVFDSVESAARELSRLQIDSRPDPQAVPLARVEREDHGRLSITRRALPMDRSSPPGSRGSTATVTPILFLIARISASEDERRSSEDVPGRVSTRTVRRSIRPGRSRTHWNWGASAGIDRMSSSIWVGNRLTPRRMIMSSVRPVTFSMRRMLRAVPGGAS